MAPVLQRSKRRFLTRQIVIEKIVDRRLGFNAATPPSGFKWDQRHIAHAEDIETLPNPGLEKKHLGGIPRGYWQNGPVTSRLGADLKVQGVQKVLSEGKERWAPVVHNGRFCVWKDSDFLFSDNSVLEVVDPLAVDSSGRSVHTLAQNMRAGSPIRATIYRRTTENEVVPWREYKHRAAFTGTLDSDGIEQTTVSGDIIYWDNIDTYRREFITRVRNGAVFLQFNQYAPEDITSTTVPAALTDFNDKEYLGDSDGTPGQKFYTRFFPLDLDVLHVYTIDPITSLWSELTVVSSFTAANQVKIDPDIGAIIFGDAGDLAIPTAGTAIYISYQAVPRIEYEEENYGELTTALDADVSPIGQSINRGFIVLSRSELDVAAITLETSKSSYRGRTDTYGPVYVGADYAPLVATVYSSSGKIVPNIEVLFEFELDSPGGLGGSGSTSERRTGVDGKARTHYSPPNSADEMGFYVKEVTGTFDNELEVRFDAGFEEEIDVYTYYVLKDDPWLGKVGAATGETAWTSAPPNGRKVIMYAWDPVAINPITGEYGAYAPIHPYSITDGNILHYHGVLQQPDSTSTVGSANLGAYWVVSDRFVTIKASAYSPRFGKRIYSNNLVLRVELPPYMKGEYVNDALQRIPFGWRILDDSYEYASAINGATWITINPIAGPYDIVDVIAGDKLVWEGLDYDYVNGPFDVSRPFAYLTIQFTIV